MEEHPVAHLPLKQSVSAYIHTFKWRRYRDGEKTTSSSYSHFLTSLMLLWALCVPFKEKPDQDITWSDARLTSFRSVKLPLQHARAKKSRWRTTWSETSTKLILTHTQLSNQTNASQTSTQNIFRYRNIVKRYQYWSINRAAVITSRAKQHQCTLEKKRKRLMAYLSLMLTKTQFI